MITFLRVIKLLKFDYIAALVLFLRVGLDPTVRFLHCDLGVMGLNCGNSLSACGGKAANIGPSPDPAVAEEAFVHWAALLLVLWVPYHSSFSFIYFLFFLFVILA